MGSHVGILDATELHMVDGNYYDLHSFRHPGGDHVLQLSLGMDITASVKSHHFSDRPWREMEKYRVDPKKVRGKIEQTCNYTFKQDGFFETCKRRVVALLGEHRVRAKVSNWYKAKVAVTLALWVVSWWHCCYRPFWWPAILTSLAMRPILAGIGHEGIHGRLPPLKCLMEALIMFPSDRWHYEHCFLHHPHCKRFEHDPDEIFPLGGRLNEKTPWRNYHRLQVLSEISIGLIMGIGSAADHGIIKLIEGSRQVSLDSLGTTLKLGVLLVLTQLLPCFTHPDGFYAGLMVHICVVSSSNVLAIVVFRISHITERTSSLHYSHVDGVDWGEHQLRTTCNFATSAISVSGMLEMQIEHHLFPSLTYAQQGQIRDVVKSTAQEFNIPYHEFNGLFHGIRYHWSYLQELGNPVVQSVRGHSE